MTGGAAGIEEMGAKTAVQCPDSAQDSALENDPSLMSAVPRGDPVLYEPKEMPPNLTGAICGAAAPV